MYRCSTAPRLAPWQRCEGCASRAGHSLVLPERLARWARPGRSCHGVAPSPAGVDDPARRWRDRAAESRVVSVRVRGVRLHGPVLCCPHSESTPPLLLGAPVGVSAPSGTSRSCPQPTNGSTAARSAPGCQQLQQLRWPSAATATSPSPATIQGASTCFPRIGIL